MKKIFAVIIFILNITPQMLTGSEVSAVRVIDGIQEPWSLVFITENEWLISDRRGQLRRAVGGRLSAEPVSGIPTVTTDRAQGLLDLALHPDFPKTKWLYMAYTAAGDGGVGTELARARYEQGALHDLEVLFRAAPKVSNGTNHFGARLLFLKDGTLLLTLGDRIREESQSLQSHLGTIVRLNDDGSIPANNPFIGQSNALPEVFSYGHRNVQGIAMAPSGKIWVHEHGPRGGDEINELQAGGNYGWPAATFGLAYSGGRISEHTSLPGMIDPLFQWTPSIAPSGMAFYLGDMIPEWKGDLFVGALAGRHLHRVDIEGGRIVGNEALTLGVQARVRDVRFGPDGYLYMLTEGSQGGVWRIAPK